MEIQMKKRSIDFEIWKRETINTNMHFYLVVRQIIIYNGLSSRAPGFQFLLGSLKELTDTDTCPFGSIALSMKENFFVFFLFCFFLNFHSVEKRLEWVELESKEFSQEWVCFFWSSSTWMCWRCFISGWVSKTRFFVWWSTIWEQFIYWTNTRNNWHCCGIEIDRIAIGSKLGFLCALWPADELRECRLPWNPFSFMQDNLQL